ncbi:MAG: murein biosynthesis integral membrane protein MurJ [Hyphomicrobiales bacterium]
MSILRSAATVGGLTMVSRVLGFGRDVMMAAVLGTGPIADAFFVAFRFPNLFRRLFAEGAFNAAFVPLFAKQLEAQGPAGARQFGEEAMNALLFALLVFSGVAELAMPWAMYLIAPGFAGDPAKFDLAVLLTRIAFPYLVFMSLTALISGVLNSLGKFAAAAAAPIVLNVLLIGVLLALLGAGLEDGERAFAGKALAWGVSLAGALQLLLVYVAASRAGFRLVLARPRLTPGVRRLLALGVPGVIAGGITQINILIGTIIASLQAGAVSYLYYADRIYQLPLGVVGVAIGVVLLPDLARRLKAGDDSGAGKMQNRALETAMLFTVPAAVALAVIAAPIISVLFERGNFGPGDTGATAPALAAFAFGLPAFVAIKVFSPGFFAREDTRTPMLFAGVSVAVNIIVSLVLFATIGHVGIAIATSLAGWVNAGLLMVALWRRGFFNADHRLARHLGLIVVASAVMGAVLWLLWGGLAGWLDRAQPLWTRAGALAVLITAGLAVFWAMVEITGVARLRDIMRSRRLPPGG